VGVPVGLEAPARKFQARFDEKMAARENSRH
jgi:hypothetical protein